VSESEQVEFAQLRAIHFEDVCTPLD